MNKEDILFIIIGSLIGVLFLFIILIGIEKHELVECQQWQHDSNEYEYWYSVDWQKEQCKEYNIDLK